MRYRTTGGSALQLEVSEIGFGCSRIGGVFSGRDDRREAIAALKGALDAGITLFDTADMYAQGESERLVGQAFRHCRDRVVIATKGGYCLPARRRLAATIKPLVRPLIRALRLRRSALPAGASGALSQDFSAAHIRTAVEASLRRLGTDRIDLYQLHSPPRDVIESGDWVGILEELRGEGKIRCWGIAADTAEAGLSALAHPGIGCVQAPFGLLDLEALDTLLPTAAARGVGVIVRGCFGGGLLKDTLQGAELREATPKWPRVEAYREIAARLGRPALEVALQFALRAPGVSAALVGMRTERHLADNVAYYAAPPLADVEWGELAAVKG